MKKNEIFTHSVGKDRPELHDVIAHSTKPIEQSMPCTKPGQYVPVQKKESSNVILLHSVEKLKINHISSWKFYLFFQIIKITCICIVYSRHIEHFPSSTLYFIPNSALFDKQMALLTQSHELYI